MKTGRHLILTYILYPHCSLRSRQRRKNIRPAPLKLTIVLLYWAPLKQYWRRIIHNLFRRESLETPMFTDRVSISNYSRAAGWRQLAITTSIWQIYGQRPTLGDQFCRTPYANIRASALLTLSMKLIHPRYSNRIWTPIQTYQSS